MSDLLQLASALRRSSDEQLRMIFSQRQVNLQSKDFFDLAEQLLTEKSIDAALSRLTAHEIEGLIALLEGESSEPSASQLSLARMHALAVEQPADSSAQLRVLSVVAARARTLLDQLPELPATLVAHTPSLILVDEQTDSLGAISAFELQLGLTELVLDLDQRLVKVVGKASIGLTDFKRLAQQLRKPVEVAKGLYQLAQQLHLIEISGGRWVLSAQAELWLTLEISQRWQLCAEAWLEQVGLNAIDELRERLNSSSSLSESLAQTFILADKNLKATLQQLVIVAEWCGLAVGDKPNHLLTLLLESELHKAKQLLEKYLPKPIAQLIIQADQTMIAPGPLPTHIEVELRNFVELEQVSVATSYRITALSVTHGLETGMTEESIRRLLAELSPKPLPQPVDYLIRETAARFKRLTIVAGQSPDRSIIQSMDGLLLTEILNDVRLRPYALKPIAAAQLSSRFEPDMMYFGLRENGFLAVRVDANGEVISPRKSALAASAQNLERPSSADLVSPGSVIDPVARYIATLRSAEDRIGSQPTDDDLLRQVQLAIKNKTELTVYLTMRDGSEAAFRMLPKSVANGRLRGLDAKADAERVLPLAQIIRIEF